MRQLVFIILLFGALYAGAQDKLIFRDGKTRSCKIVSVNRNTVSFKDSVNSVNITTLSKNDILVAEYANGSVFIFGKEETQQPKVKEPVVQGPVLKDNMIGVQMFGIFLGRASLSYERMFNDQQFGICVPLALSFNPYPNSFTFGSPGYSNKGVNFVTGVDLNYYFNTASEYTRFFIGPRLRYGTDVWLYNITGFSAQAQNGFLFHSINNQLISHTLAFGLGFVRVISSQAGNSIDSKQSYPWISLTYRLNFKW